MGWSRRVAGGVLLAVMLVIAVPAQAGAGARGDYTGDGVRIRTQPSTSAPIVGYGYRGNQLCAYVSSGDWYYHRNLRTGRRGWSSSYYVGFYYPLRVC